MRKSVLLPALLFALAPAASAQVVIAEIYGGGGNTGAPYKEDYVVLFNNGDVPVDLSSYSIQYAAVNGTTFSKQNLTGSIAARDFYYILLSTGGNGNANVPFLNTANVTASPMIQVSARRGRIALSSAQTAYSGNTAGDPHTIYLNLVDFVGFGGGSAANTPVQYEGAGTGGTFAPDPNVSNSLRRTEQNTPTQRKGADEPLGTHKAQALSYLDTNNNGGDVATNNLSGGSLPVELVNFTAQADGERLRFGWTTASETNNAGFRLEGRSVGAAEWMSFGSVLSKAPGGTSTEMHAYTFVTDRMRPGRYEVRLVQTDIDGTIHYASADEVEIAVDGSHELTVLGSRAVRLAVSEPQQATIRLFDVTGREVASLFRGEIGSPVTVDLPQGLAAGMYLVRVEGERFSATRNVVLR